MTLCILFILQVSRKSVQSESEMCASNDLPPRPQTVAASHPRGRSNSSKPSQSKSLNATLKAQRSRLNHCYVFITHKNHAGILNQLGTFCRKNRPRAKVNSWLKNNDSIFKISGKKIHVEGSSDLDKNSRKSSEIKQHGTIIVPHRIPGHSLALNNSSEKKDTSSINAVVGKKCFKKEKEIKNTKQKDEVCAVNVDMEEADSSSDITDYVTEWLV